MRISTHFLQQSSISNLLERQKDIAEIQKQISTGKRLINPSDDPIGTARSVGLTNELQRIEQFDKNTIMGNSTLSLEEFTLNEVNTLLIRVKELAVQAGNTASLNPENRTIIANELRETSNTLLSLANTQDTNGNYIFSGYQAYTKPFSAGTNNAIVYNGDDGQQRAEIGFDTEVILNDSGKSVFVDINATSGSFVTANGSSNSGTGIVNIGQITDSTTYAAAIPESYTIQFDTPATTFDVIEDSSSTVLQSNVTYTPGETITVAGISVSITGTPAATDTFTIKAANKQDIFMTINKLASSLENLSDPTTISYNVGQSLTNIDTAHENIIKKQAIVGTRLEAIDQQADLNRNRGFITQQTLGSIEEIDLTESISNLSAQSIALEAAQATYVRVIGLSLFNFL